MLHEGTGMCRNRSSRSSLRRSAGNHAASSTCGRCVGSTHVLRARTDGLKARVIVHRCDSMILPPSPRLQESGGRKEREGDECLGGRALEYSGANFSKSHRQWQLNKGGTL
jgi:hypothetical protein